MIGFFDSGFGGLTILKEVVKILPEYSYIYLGDNARSPYGCHDKDIIYKYTCEGIEELFERGAQLVVLACNTSSAVALRKIQQEYLLKYHPDKKVLGIIIPTAGEMIGNENIGIFATVATVASNVYMMEIHKRNSSAKIIQQACPLLVPAIEAGKFDEIEMIVEKYVNDIFLKKEYLDSVILGCTHYAIVEDVFRKYISTNVKIISQGKIIAKKISDYLDRHFEIKTKLKKNGERIFLTTENSPRIQELASLFYGEKIDIKLCVLRK